MGSKIALIDDSKVMRSILRKSILMSGHKISDFLEAANGEEGLELVRENRDSLDLIITDIHMPGMSGIEMLKSFRTIAGSEKVPVIVISSDSSMGVQQQWEQFGVCGFIAKPFSLQDVVSLLDAVLGTNATGQPG